MSMATIELRSHRGERLCQLAVAAVASTSEGPFSGPEETLADARRPCNRLRNR
jgi:hypothetical protein